MLSRVFNSRFIILVGSGTDKILNLPIKTQNNDPTMSF
ncbi:hypothetical protein RINTHM_190 [Richelia intracellularis HM01]|nr:hypothetical protein RINTHM_190 [Richelia intracellularis HM01]